MKTLQRYLAPITVAGKCLGDSYYAYKMDNESRSDMRIDVGLATCNCCDYFQIIDNKVYLIEETQLVEKYKNLKRQHQNLNEKQIKILIDRTIKMRNRLKVYGSMLVLCRLASICESAKKLLMNKPYVFLLVVSGVTENDDYIIFDSIKTDLLSELKSQLSRETVSDVKILTPELLETMLSTKN